MLFHAFENASAPKPGQPQLQAQAAADGAPGAKTELDQTHCTVETKVARVARMHEARALAGQRIDHTPGAQRREA